MAASTAVQMDSDGQTTTEDDDSCDDEGTGNTGKPKPRRPSETSNPEKVFNPTTPTVVTIEQAKMFGQFFEGTL